MNRLTALLIAAGIGLAAGAGAACKLTADHYIATAAKEQKDAAEAYQAKTAELNQVSAELEQARNDRKIVYRTITKQVEKIVDRDVYRNTCLDDDGVHAINAALAGRAGTGEPTAAVPAAGAAGR
jgi:predicted phage-related endonuclease